MTILASTGPGRAAGLGEKAQFSEYTHATNSLSEYTTKQPTTALLFLIMTSNQKGSHIPNHLFERARVVRIAEPSSRITRPAYWEHLDDGVDNEGGLVVRQPPRMVQNHRIASRERHGGGENRSRSRSRFRSSSRDRSREDSGGESRRRPRSRDRSNSRERSRSRDRHRDASWNYSGRKDLDYGYDGVSYDASDEEDKTNQGRSMTPDPPPRTSPPPPPPSEAAPGRTDNFSRREYEHSLPKEPQGAAATVVHAIYSSTEARDTTIRLEMDLLTDVDDELEEFNRLTRTGNFALAKSFFDTNLRAHVSRENPSIFVQYAEMLLEKGDFRSLLRMDGRTVFSGESTSLDDSPKQRLELNWKLIRAVALCSSQHDLRTVWEGISRPLKVSADVWRANSTEVSSKLLSIK